jgi:hypothetical protein
MFGVLVAVNTLGACVAAGVPLRLLLSTKAHSLSSRHVSAPLRLCTTADEVV